MNQQNIKSTEIAVIQEWLKKTTQSDFNFKECIKIMNFEKAKKTLPEFSIPIQTEIDPWNIIDQYIMPYNNFMDDENKVFFHGVKTYLNLNIFKINTELCFYKADQIGENIIFSNPILFKIISIDEFPSFPNEYIIGVTFETQEDANYLQLNNGLDNYVIFTVEALSVFNKNIEQKQYFIKENNRYYYGSLSIYNFKEPSENEIIKVILASENQDTKQINFKKDLFSEKLLFKNIYHEMTESNIVVQFIGVEFYNYN